MLRRQTTAFVLPLVLALAGCSGSGVGPPPEEQQRSIVVESYPAEAAAASPPGPPPDGMTNAIVDATVRPAHLVVTMWGTPGCMPYPVAVGWLDSTTVDVVTANRTDPACSSEHLAVSQVVVLPVEHSPVGVRTVRVDGLTVSFAFRTVGRRRGGLAQAGRRHDPARARGGARGAELLTSPGVTSPGVPAARLSPGGRLPFEA